jgi:hypothetical protein
MPHTTEQKLQVAVGALEHTVRTLDGLSGALAILGRLEACREISSVMERCYAALALAREQ